MAVPLVCVRGQVRQRRRRRRTLGVRHEHQDAAVERAHTGEPAECLEEFKANVGAAETAHPRTFDIQVESGFGSWDYRFTEVNVQAAS